MANPLSWVAYTMGSFLDITRQFFCAGYTSSSPNTIARLLIAVNLIYVLGAICVDQHLY